MPVSGRDFDGHVLREYTSSFWHFGAGFWRAEKRDGDLGWV